MSSVDERTKEAPVEATVYSPARGESADEAKRFIDAADEGIVMVVQVKSPAHGDPRFLDALEACVKSLQKTLERVATQHLTLERLIEVLTSEDSPPAPAAILQVRRNVEARERLLEEFGALTSAQIADLAGSTAENRSATANRWRQEHRIFGVRHSDTVYYPGFQFGDDGRPLPAVGQVLEALSAHGSTDWEVALWFTATTSSLGGRRPVDLLNDEPDAVVEAARLEVAPVSGQVYLPPPPDPVNLRPSLYMWERGQRFVRCHDSSFGATEFNPRRDISMRFRPFTSRARTVPTIYGSEAITGALSETLLQLVPTSGPDRRLRQSRLVAHVASTLAPRRDLQLIDLRDGALDELDLTRAALIESPALAYPETAAWASALFHCPAEPDGLVWNSRQEPQTVAFVLFARGRVERRDLEVVDPPVPLAVGRGLDRVYEAAERLDLTIVR